MKTMHMYDPPYPLWTIWRQLSLLDHALVLILGAVFVYCLLTTIRTMLRLHAVWNRPRQDRATVCEALAVLATRYAGLRQLIAATFYFFGVVLFLGMESLTNVIDEGKDPLGVIVLDKFLLLSAFAANVFFIFLVLHFMQWSGSAVVDELSKRLTPRS
jgi:hypothetical protein